MKNYTYGWKLKEVGYVEVPESEYTERMNDMKVYVVVGKTIDGNVCTLDVQRKEIN